MVKWTAGKKGLPVPCSSIKSSGGASESSLSNSSCWRRRFLALEPRFEGSCNIHEQKIKKRVFLRLLRALFNTAPSDSTVSEEAGIEHRTVATTALAVRRSNHSARPHPKNNVSFSINYHFGCESGPGLSMHGLTSPTLQPPPPPRPTVWQRFGLASRPPPPGTGVSVRYHLVRIRFKVLFSSSIK
jgi:hypothetical protein